MLTLYMNILLFCIPLLLMSQSNIFVSANVVSSFATGNGNKYISVSKYAEYNPSLYNLGIKVTEKDLNNSILFANTVVNSLRRLETNLGWSDIKVKAGTPSHGMYISFAPEREAVKRGREALIAVKASRQLLDSFCNKHNVNYHDCAKYLTNFKFTSTPLKASCARLQNYCSQDEYLSAYRSIDGSCNHILNNNKGQSFTGFTRLLYPDYLDGIHEPRRAADKKPLPSARIISISIVNHTDNPHNRLTLAVMQWGQFIEHDLSRVASAIMVHTENPIECCSPEGNNLSPRYVHPFCSPVSVPTNDKYYSKKGLDCMNYVRSIPALRSDCSFGPTDQVNQATHFLDGSQIYGSTYRKSTSLRQFVDGKFETSSFNGKNYLPTSRNLTEKCISNTCFKSGDPRVNFQPQLTIMHTIWFREHNRIAEELMILNGHWDDETLFQEARRIVIAEMQHITYNEWIKVILFNKYKAIIDASYEYDESVDPSVSNSFATAAIRSLKSLYDGNIKLYDKNRRIQHSLSLQQHFNNPDVIHKPGVLDNLVRGLATQSSQKIDRNYAEDLINKLYTNGHFGLDVLSMDIQRGRDHGLPGYIQYRSLCGLSDIETFDTLNDVMTKDHIYLLSKIYTSPKDIDLIVGGLLENLHEDVLLGPTFSCIIADQFNRTKKGDRYFYSNENQPRPFSLSQLKEIKKVSLARIFCDNGDNIVMMQPNVFEKISISNNMVSCNGKEIPRVRLSLWTESRERYFYL